MLRNYLKIALRRLKKNKAYSIINILGLAIGLAACLLILLYIRYELSYDTYNRNADRIYRVTEHIKTSGHQSNYAISPASLATLLKADSPEIEDVARLVQMSHLISIYPDILVSHGTKHFYESNLYYADPSIFKIFTINVSAGKTEDGLTKPYTAFISASLAHKIFGRKDPVGQSIQIGESQYYEITGVFQDFPYNAHFHPDVLASFSSVGPIADQLVYTYLLLKNKSDFSKVSTDLSEINTNVLSHAPTERIKLSLIPLLDIHLHSRLLQEAEPEGDIRYIYLFGAIALVILLIACFNYVNMTIAQSANRAAETGIRKVTGASRRQLIAQYFLESFLANFLALIVALCFVEWTLPYFNTITNIHLSLWTIGPLWLIGIIVGVLIVISLLSGSYPALLLSSFHPAAVLKGKTFFRSDRGLSKWIVFLQFVVSVVMIICAIVIQRQMNYVQRESWNVRNRSVVIIKNRDGLTDNYSSFKSELLKNPQVKFVTTTQFMPGLTRDVVSFNSDDIEGYHQMTPPIPVFYGDNDFVEALGLKIIEGRNFSTSHPADLGKAILVNRKAAETFGWRNPVGKYIWFKTANSVDGKLTFSREKKYVVGVVDDFHYGSLKDEVKPVIILPVDKPMVYIAVQIANNHVSKTISFIKNEWNSFIPEKPFDYSFLQDEYAAMYQKGNLMSNILINFTALAVAIACLGLFGIAAFTIKQRTREISIRRVLGATEANIIGMMSGGFLKLVTIAVLFAIPIAWLAMNRWLRSYAYHASLKWWIFFLAGMLAIVIALFTVLFQAVRAARANPVDALKYE